jgi:hypothetical protein
MMRKLLVILVSVLVSVLFTGCDDWLSNIDWWARPVIPDNVTRIEAVHVDNAGELPVISDGPIKKEAYMLGIKWETSNVSGDDNMFITGLAVDESDYKKNITCLTPFNATIPAGTDISELFKEADTRYLPEGVDEGFVLLATPNAGEHVFRVEYYKYENEEIPAFSCDTPTIELY